MSTLDQIIDWFRAAVPEPTDKSRAVQIGCHYEEVSEMLAATQDEGERRNLEGLAGHYKHGVKRVATLDHLGKVDLTDALSDQIVTAIGVAHMFGIDIAGALAEVNRSNWSKFNEDGKPDFDENGKIKKGPHYSPPRLAPFAGDRGAR